MFILRVYLKAGQAIELIYRGADACRADALKLADNQTGLRDDFGKALVIDDVSQIAAVMTSDYDAELAGVDEIERCKAGLREKMQRRAAAAAGFVGGRPPIMPQGLVA
jgi:hypothetical protein